MVRVFAVSCFMLLTASHQGSAQVSFNPEGQEIGATTRWTHKYGTRQLTYLGPDEKGLKYEWRNKVGGQDLVFLIWRNSEGQNVRLEGGDEVQIYAPHNCRLTIGRCEYAYSYMHKTQPNRQEKRIVINSVDGDVWSYKRYTEDETPENLDREGTFTVDEFGIVIDSGSLTRIPPR